MSFKSKMILMAAIVVRYDAFASVVSRVFRVEYAEFAALSLILYVGEGMLGAYRQGFFYGLLLGTIAGAVDATVGWAISSMIGPFTGYGGRDYFGPAVVTLVFVLVTFKSTVLGATGSAAYTALRLFKPRI